MSTVSQKLFVEKYKNCLKFYLNFKYPSRIRKAAPLEIKCNLFLLRGQSHQLVFSPETRQ